MANYRLKFHSVLVFTTLVGLSAAQGFDDTQKQSNEPLVGEWIIESSNLAGKEKKPAPPTARIRITKDQLLLINAGKTELELDYRLNGAKTPKEIDLTLELDKGSGPVKMILKGIFKADGERLILCIHGDPHAERPKEFKKATKENGLMVFTLTNATTSPKQ